MLKPDKENIDKLIVSFLSKDASSEEQEFLLQWIESDSNNREYYARMYRVWVSSAQLQPLDPEREKSALQKIHRKIFNSPEDGDGSDGRNGREPKTVLLRESKTVLLREPKTVLLRNVIKYAAAVALLLVVSTYGIMRFSMNRTFSGQISELTCEAHYGSRVFTCLSDGSKVWLNSGSKLSVQGGYNVNERQVHLTGEAYFEVVTNPEKPFIVQAGNLSVRATGTAFNVKAYPEEDQVTATLVEGTIIVEGYDEREEKFRYKISPGQTVTCATRKSEESLENIRTHVAVPDSNAQKQIKTPLPVSIGRPKTEVLTSWMKERWIIDNEDFGSIAVKLERRYNIKIHFDSEKLKQYRFTGTIERETVEQMFDVFRYSIPLKYSIEKGVVSLSLDRILEKRYEKAWKRD